MELKRLRVFHQRSLTKLTKAVKGLEACFTQMTHSPIRCSDKGLSFGNGGCYFGCNSKVSCKKDNRAFQIM